MCLFSVKVSVRKVGDSDRVRVSVRVRVCIRVRGGVRVCSLHLQYVYHTVLGLGLGLGLRSGLSYPKRSCSFPPSKIARHSYNVILISLVQVRFRSITLLRK
jgi:hypothetical protein